MAKTCEEVLVEVPVAGAIDHLGQKPKALLLGHGKWSSGGVVRGVRAGFDTSGPGFVLDFDTLAAFVDAERARRTSK